MSTAVSKPSRSKEAASRKSSENVRPQSPKSSKTPKAPKSPGSHEVLIPDEWDKKKGHKLPAERGPTMEEHVDTAHSPAHEESLSGPVPAEEASTTHEDETTSVRGRRSSSVSMEHQRDFERPRRRVDKRPDEMNSEEEPFVKPGTMRPKAPPPQTAKATRSSGLSSPMSKTFPAMSEQEFLSRVGSGVMVRQEPAFKEPIRVLVTAVTTELAYRMLIPLARGDVFGVDQPIVLHLYDESENISDMEGIAMEMEDCSFELLKQIVFTGEDEVAFLNVDVAFLNDSVPVDGDRALFEKCVQTYAGHGKALSAHAKKTVKVIITGHPINTNTYVCIRYAKSIPYENFTGLSRLNHNRAVTLLSQRLGVIPNKIVNMIVWGHRGDMLLPDYSRSVVIKKAKRYKISDLVSRDYLDEGLPEDVKIRDDLVQKLTKHPGILSRAKAACDQMRDWWIGLPAGQFVTMSVLSDGVYGVPPDLVFSYPVFIDNARSWKVVQGITVDEKLRHCITESAKDLERERDEAMEVCTELAL
ncbi:malate dehydrogenase, cytoplasmic [Rhipicephalus microplus]|uniref:malate dehydrogenase, cytoplasmic n=1 Tax=Rhipicephalus microplus TaxID=6941 RepID=UPI003F6B6538